MKSQRYGAANGSGGQTYGQQFAEIHANALPGVTRPEEGDAMLSEEDLERGSRRTSSRRAYNDMERSRERERYENYLDERDSEKLPNAFDLGWKRNLQHLFGTQTLLWAFPVSTTTGDGWHWEPNSEWVTSREAIKRERERQWQEDEDQGRHGTSESQRRPNGYQQRFPIRGDSERHYLTTSNGVVDVPISGSRSPGKADHILGRTDQYFDRNFEDRSPSSGMSMKTLRRRGSFDENSDEEDEYDASSDEESRLSHTFPGAHPPEGEVAGRKQD